MERWGQRFSLGPSGICSPRVLFTPSPSLVPFSLWIECFHGIIFLPRLVAFSSGASLYRCIGQLSTSGPVTFSWWPLLQCNRTLESHLHHSLGNPSTQKHLLLSLCQRAQIYRGKKKPGRDFSAGNFYFQSLQALAKVREHKELDYSLGIKEGKCGENKMHINVSVAYTSVITVVMAKMVRKMMIYVGICFRISGHNLTWSL